MSLCVFTSLILVVNMHLVLNFNSITILDFFSISVMSVGLYVIWMWSSQELLYEDLSGAITNQYVSLKFYAVVFLSTMLSFLGTFWFKSIAFNFWPTPSKFLRQRISMGAQLTKSSTHKTFLELCASHHQAWRATLPPSHLMPPAQTSLST